jgi:hypothetical protein
MHFAQTYGVVLMEKTDITGVQFKDERVVRVMFKDPKTGADIERACNTLLCACDNAIDAELFNACVNRGLVYNAGLVVDNEHQTADDNIFAIGATVRLSRRCAPEDYRSFKEYNAFEMGQKFAAELLNRAAPESAVMRTFSAVRSGKRQLKQAQATAGTIAGRIHSSGRGPARMHKPVTLTATLSDDLFYVRCAAPAGLADLHEYTTNDEVSGAITALKTDALGVIVEVVYLGKQPLDPHILRRVVGWHEAVLRDAVNSYIRGDILDWSR